MQQILIKANEPIRPEMGRYSQAEDGGVQALWQLHVKRNKFQMQYMERWNACEGLDGLLSEYLSPSSRDGNLKLTEYRLAPTTPFASVEHTLFKHVGYTGVYNILDYSCLSFPCGVHVDAAVDVPAVDENELTKLDGEVQGECMFNILSFSLAFAVPVPSSLFPCAACVAFYNMEALSSPHKSMANVNVYRQTHRRPRAACQPAAGRPQARGGEGGDDGRGYFGGAERGKPLMEVRSQKPLSCNV